MYIMYLYALISVPQKQTEAIFNLKKSKMIIVILLAMYNTDKFSEL